ncbi:alpha/beta hydrolase [Idiomarina sp. HP20-50]|uniref:alpha/beta fold hydrolase n=1 Tax=Idiomarina sp. HP20-50 TaxID=3070813 RepID=UPI00294AD52F|nr:alpha/beta hydrolase [Idiomarina sp. HP20-50]MDV6317181.1 alpha/beta hydrolase [Idiomarina sp. HP20-50]
MALERATPVSYQLDWGTVKGLCWGDPSNIQVIATHGWLDNCHSFLPVANYWSPDNGGFLVLDWPGHGHSDHRPVGSYYHFIDYAYDLWHLIQQQDWQQVTLLGHSMGGFVSNVVAALCPERIQKLIVIEAFGLLVSDGANASDQLKQGFLSRRKLQTPRWRGYANLDSAVEARAAQADFSADLVRLIVERGCERNPDGRWYWRADARVKTVSAYRLPSSAVDDILEELTMPVIVVRGSDGYEKLEDALERWQDKVTNLSCVTLKGGHHVHMEQPEKIAELL